jgi:hypothetical protein
MKTHRQSLIKVFAWPLILFVLGLTGLVGALLADGLWDGLGAALVATGVVAIVWARIKADRGLDVRSRCEVVRR